MSKGHFICGVFAGMVVESNFIRGVFDGVASEATYLFVAVFRDVKDLERTTDETRKLRNIESEIIIENHITEIQSGGKIASKVAMGNTEG